jgi:hypothetical protein
VTRSLLEQVSHGSKEVFLLRLAKAPTELRPGRELHLYRLSRQFTPLDSFLWFLTFSILCKLKSLVPEVSASSHLNLTRRDSNAIIIMTIEFNALNDAKIDKLPVLPFIIVRCAFNTKMRIIETLHRQNRLCAIVSTFLFITLEMDVSSGFAHGPVFTYIPVLCTC